MVEKSNFLTTGLVTSLKTDYGTPLYVYDKETLVKHAREVLAFPNHYGLKVRFAMKACPNAAILQLFSSLGICVDASSGNEVIRAVRAGIRPQDISLSSQELPADFKALIELGIDFDACSLHQLEEFGKCFSGGSCGIRFNPGKGSGGTGKTNVGGPSASFGIWYELIDKVKAVSAKYDLKIVRIHTHIGSGSDPKVWQDVSVMSLNLVKEFPDVTALNLGGGYKIGRMDNEISTNLTAIGGPVAEAFKHFAIETGREIKLEIEPGTYLMATAGALVATVQDIVSTGTAGYTFLKLDAGMTDVLRPSLYGAQHPIVVFPRDETSQTTSKYVVVGHCCESGDLFTCAPGEPDILSEREVCSAIIGDLVSIEGVGAYCSSMSTKNYNSFLDAPEILLDENKTPHVIRRRQTMEQMLENEVSYRP